MKSKFCARNRNTEGILLSPRQALSLKLGLSSLPSDTVIPDSLEHLYRVAQHRLDATAENRFLQMYHDRLDRFINNYIINSEFRESIEQSEFSSILFLNTYRIAFCISKDNIGTFFLNYIMTTSLSEKAREVFTANKHIKKRYKNFTNALDLHINKNYYASSLISLAQIDGISQEIKKINNTQSNQINSFKSTLEEFCLITNERYQQKLIEDTFDNKLHINKYRNSLMHGDINIKCSDKYSAKLIYWLIGISMTFNNILKAHST